MTMWAVPFGVGCQRPRPCVAMWEGEEGVDVTSGGLRVQTCRAVSSVPARRHELHRHRHRHTLRERWRLWASGHQSMRAAGG